MAFDATKFSAWGRGCRGFFLRDEICLAPFHEVGDKPIPEMGAGTDHAESVRRWLILNWQQGSIFISMATFDAIGTPYRIVLVKPQILPYVPNML